MNEISTIVPIASLVLVNRSISVHAFPVFDENRRRGRRIEPMIDELVKRSVQIDLSRWSYLDPDGVLDIDSYRFYIYLSLVNSMRKIATVPANSRRETPIAGLNRRLIMSHNVTSDYLGQYLHWFSLSTYEPAKRTGAGARTLNRFVGL